MEYNFENKCTIDQKIMTESVRSNRKVFTTVSLIPTVITGLGILSILVRAAVQFYLDLPMLLRWIIFFLLFLRISTTPRRTARRVIKDFKRIYKVESVEAATQFGDKIVYALEGADAHFALDRHRAGGCPVRLFSRRCPDAAQGNFVSVT